MPATVAAHRIHEVVLTNGFWVLQESGIISLDNIVYHQEAEGRDEETIEASLSFEGYILLGQHRLDHCCELSDSDKDYLGYNDVV